MTLFHRPPRAGVDPIDDDATALAACSLALHDPPRDETILVLLDDARRGIAMVVVSDTTRPDDVIDVADRLFASDITELVDAVVIATVRPGADGDDPADVDRWLELSEIADDAAIDLLEWFVIGDAVSRPRDQLGEPPRW